MQRRENFHWVRFCFLLILVGGILGLGLAGCQRVNYPKPKVTSPLDRPGQCANCQKKIESVTKENLVTIDGVQYIVCDEKCAEGVREWLKQLDER